MLTDNMVILRLVLSAVLGGIIGLEREMHGRAAGWRTHILVCVGSCLIMLVSFYITFTLGSQFARIDPTRIAAQVVSGIGFLGAGTIIRFRASVKGLTTAASLWAAAGIGLAVGCGFYQAALTATVLVLIALLFTRVEHYMLKRDYFCVLHVHAEGKIYILSEIRKILRKNQAEIVDFEVNREHGDKEVDIEIEIKIMNTSLQDTIINRITNIEGVTEAKWGSD
ncbi:MAG: MgtC/SapB family protein [Candidatus Omnitrophota bacterium]